MSSITILLCTCNGAPYLEAQLASIADQDPVDWALWVSDDGSTDGTLSILQRFRDAHPSRDIRLLSGAGRGAAANYMTLLCHPELASQTIAFCDQDDVWLPDKLSRALSSLNAFGSDAPAAYAAGSIVTNAGLTEIGRLRTTQTKPRFDNALVQNVLHGSTIVLNPAAHRLLRQAGPVSIPFHDWWCYLVLTACAAPIVLDDTPALLYRQHGSNQIGYNQAQGAGRRRFRLIADGTYRGWLLQNANTILTAELPMTPDARLLSSRFLALQDRSGPVRMVGYGKLGLRRQTRSSSVMLCACAGLGYV